jgi:hypothetical protein
VLKNVARDDYVEAFIGERTRLPRLQVVKFEIGPAMQGTDIYADKRGVRR